MLLDRSLRATIRNFSTLFLVVFMLLGPLHLLYAIVFHDVLELRELHPAIEGFPPNRLVRGVGQAAVSQARIWFWALVVVEVVALPVLLRACQRVLGTDAAGDVPTAIGAWRSLRAETAMTTQSGNKLGTVAAALLIAAASGTLLELIGMSLVNLLPDSVAFAAIALTQATARSTGVVFFLVPFAHALAARPGRTQQVPDLF